MIRAIIVDDERPAIGKLTNMLTASGKIEIAGTFTNALVALEALPRMEIEVIFLDVEMPEMNGITFANNVLNLNENTKIIFVTAYNEYAVDAFEVNAVDYLMKPVTKERLDKALAKVTRKTDVLSVSLWDIKVTCFGKFTVENKEGIPVKWRTKKAEEFFAYLIDHYGKTISRDKIIDVLWGSYEVEKARVNLNTTMYNVKKAFANVGVADLVKYSAGGYQLEEKRIHCDLWILKDSIAKIRTNSMKNMNEFEKIIKICTGGYLKENYFEWAEEKNKYFQGIYLELLIQLAKQYEEVEQPNIALEFLRKGLIMDSLNQRINKELIRLYLRIEDEVSAVKQYEGYKKGLKQEFEIELEESLWKWIK